MSQKPACLQINSGGLPKLSKSFPKIFTAQCDLQPCALLSVFDQKKPTVIIYCDHQDWDANKHRAFKAIGKQLSQKLQQFY